MPIIIDDPQKSNELYNKFLSVSERIGNLIYKEKDISKLISSLKQNINLKTNLNKKIPNEKMSDVIESCIKREKSARISMGMIVSSTIIILSILLILYIIYYIFVSLLDIMDWWVLAIVFMIIIVPTTLIIAYWIAKGEY